MPLQEHLKAHAHVHFGPGAPTGHALRAAPKGPGPLGGSKGGLIA